MKYSFAMLLTLAAGACLTPNASAQETKYWPLAKISFPIDVARLQQQDPRPSRLRFYAAAPKSKFELIAEKRIEELDELVDTVSKEPRKGFTYIARGDGMEEFALQYVYANGDVNPPTGSLAAQYRIVFDTRPPLVRATATGQSTVSWTVEDENVSVDSVRLEVKYPNQTEWMNVGTRAFSSRDSYTWREIPNNKTLEVRITAKDKAGHEGRSAVLRLPTNGIGAAPSDTGVIRAGTGTSTTGIGEEFPNGRPQIEYVNTNSLTVRSKFTRVTRSGIKEAILWANDGRSSWKEESRKAVNILPTDKDPSVEIPFQASKDGLYGFIVLPVNGAGGKPDDPREGDAAQWLVEVDTVKPTVEIKSIRVGAGGLNGPKVEIDWTAMDKNLMPEPITLEYATDPAAKDWKPIASKIANSGRYVWEVEDKTLWKLYVRATAVDKAGNSERVVYKDAVLVDLDKPSAVIDKVNGSGPPGATRNYSPNEKIPPTTVPIDPRPMVSQPPVPVPAPKPSPVTVPPKVEQPPVPKITVDPIPTPTVPDIKLPSTVPDAPPIPELPMLPKLPMN